MQVCVCMRVKGDGGKKGDQQKECTVQQLI